MQFEWDSDKAALNLEKHGICFEVAALVFLDDSRLTAIDDRFDYGEDRMITLGHIEERLHVVVYTRIQDTIRIISARKANKREQARYANSEDDTRP
ncbi:MAG: BrnT family toxin [Hoeflea sp.]|uniref:BrnT family toxin n=1 Tax=Hoeflea sp. TaxID=1940281 RepID=UPI001D4B8E59|nr:BrnT family toxin [Hoeflea sp.]MBU4527916.1 BrnT family toxin [Alphaproteobacteria bacterium]MBU4546049.1 BrnT family toxin [Alphaproteobacteria bacterium]MBU4553266.1 BrnT family toxin [Alphaproteobacteria bacterium]MBV1724340.1 BrnT family toxin [Hoeflea sp.]MBV1763336.1 BrnT family toxin [Hoeflea sp.]